MANVPLNGPLLDYGGVGAAMPEAYGASAPAPRRRQINPNSGVS